MVNRYLLVLVGVILGLGACSTDSSQRTSMPGSGQASTLSPAADTASMLPPDSTARRARRQATIAAPPKELAVEPPVRTKPKRGATTMADVDEEEIDSLALTRIPWNSAEGEARRAELERFLAASLPPAQQFRIRPGHDTLVTGRQGTQLLIAANAWDLPAGSPPVQLEVQEFYNPADIALAGLSTTSGPWLLETGGMLNLKATVDGRPVKLRPGAYVHLRMPAKELKPGMQLFEGVVTDSTHGDIDWQLPQPPAKLTDTSQDVDLKLTFGKAGRAHRSQHRRRHRRNIHKLKRASWPEYAGGDKQLVKDLTLFIDYSDESRARLRRGRRMSRPEKAQLISASRAAGQRVYRVVHVDFVVDTSGVISQALPASNDDKQLGESIKFALMELGYWEPGVQNMYAGSGMHKLNLVDCGRRLTVYYPEKGPVLVKLNNWHNETHRLTQLNNKLNAKKNQRQQDSLYAVRRPYYDSLAKANYQRAEENYRKAAAQAMAELNRLRTQFTDTSRAKISEEGVYQELSAQQLSWINCDRFRPEAPMVVMGINPGQPDAVVKVLFREIRSVMKGTTYTDGKVVFNVPRAAKMTLVALRRENGITYLATRDVAAEAKLYGGLVYRPVTMDELRAALSSMP